MSTKQSEKTTETVKTETVAQIVSRLTKKHSGVTSRIMRELAPMKQFCHLNEDGSIQAPNYSRIGKALGKRPQHARNVLITPLKRDQK